MKLVLVIERTEFLVSADRAEELIASLQFASPAAKNLRLLSRLGRFLRARVGLSDHGVQYTPVNGSLSAVYGYLKSAPQDGFEAFSAGSVKVDAGWVETSGCKPTSS